jgi:Holliday junction DNA helicase RuvA
VVSGIAPRALLAAIRAGDVAALRSVPGIGTKLAERILVELRDRVGELAAEVGDDRGPAPAPLDPAREETLSALLNLGYPRPEAERVLAQAAEEAGDDASLETLVRVALRKLAR